MIDFGVAKAIGQTLSERTVFTEVGRLVGTPEYMAPEQAELNNLDIDTRADIYSLGVLLYELLTGSTPFSRHQLAALHTGDVADDPRRRATWPDATVQFRRIGEHCRAPQTRAEATDEAHAAIQRGSRPCLLAAWAMMVRIRL